MNVIRSVLFFTTVALVACSHPVPTIPISADKPSVLVASGAFATITVKGTTDGAAWVEDQQPPPQITTDVGSFANPAEGGDPQLSVDGVVHGGSIVLKLYAPTTPGTATVKASFADAYGNLASATTKVAFTAPQAARLQFKCKTKNVGALLDLSVDLVVGCQASAEDVNAHQLTNSTILFKAEAGEVRTEVADDGTLNYVYHTNGGRNPSPLDVAPNMNEPHWTDCNALIRNPRDGLVTLIAYTEGDNSGADGVAGGEPFVDMNDNGSWDAGEEYFDVDNDGAYSKSQSTYIWTQTKLLWTGAISKNPAVATAKVVGTAGFDLKKGDIITVTFQVVDDNFNVLAANDVTSDAINWIFIPSGDLDIGPAQVEVTPMVDSVGLDIDSNFNIRNPTSATSYLLDAQYTVKVQNKRDSSATGDESYTLTGQIQRHLTVDDTGMPAGDNGQEMLPAVGGTLH